MKFKQAIKPATITALIAFVLWHIFATFLWIAPSSPMRELTPGNSLKSYMLPMFGQSWSVFAPNPINGSYRLDVRAISGAEGKDRITEWVHTTDVEQSRATNHLFPPRSSNLAVDQATRLKDAWDDLSAEQKKIVSLNYFKGDNSAERLKIDLDSQEGNIIPVEKYLEEEVITTAYATQVAMAVWGDDVKRVQFRISRQNNVPFEKRNHPDAKKPKAKVVDTGWRSNVVNEFQSQELFGQYFCAAPLDVCSKDDSK